MKLFVFLSLCSILGGLVDANNLCGNWEPFKDEKCFKVLDNLVNFTTAKQMCSSFGEAMILTIDSAEEQIFLSHFLFTTSKVVDNVWLVLREQGVKFHWQDGSTLAVYSNWLLEIDAQNRSRYGECIQLNSEGGLTGTWTDVSCSKKNLVVCQRAPILSLESLKGLVFKMKKEQEHHRKKYEETLNAQAIKITKLEAISLPLGFTYVQLPKEKAPIELWPLMTWKEVSSTYAGVFFRVAGGGAGQFGDVQQENAPKLTQVERHSCPSYLANTCEGINSVSRLSISSNGTWSDYVVTANGYVGSIAGMNNKAYKYHNLLRFHHSTGEVRPRNMAVKVWKRTG